MGMCEMHGQLQLLREVIKQERLVITEMEIAELGNQRVRASVLGKEIPAKVVFQNMFGCKHDSFDINGLDDAISLDLSKSIPDEYVGQYNFVTNFGTSEHVGETPEDQFECWMNIHKLCCVGGYMLHGIPEVGSWPGHGKFHYRMERVLRWARYCRYDVRIRGVFVFTEPSPKGRKKNCLMFCFRKVVGDDRIDVNEIKAFVRIMFPPGEEHY